LTKRHLSFTWWRVTSEDALAWIHWAASTGRLTLTADVRAQMTKRRLCVADVRNALVNAPRCAREDDCWNVESLDLEGAKLSLRVIIEERVIVLNVL